MYDPLIKLRVYTHAHTHMYIDTRIQTPIPRCTHYPDVVYAAWLYTYTCNTPLYGCAQMPRCTGMNLRSERLEIFDELDWRMVRYGENGESIIR